MISTTIFPYKPLENETEKASNSYLMSVIALMAGLPLPIINLIATLMFYISNRKGPYFVRWHCTQALLSQLSLLSMNSVGFWWTVSILFRDEKVTSRFIAYIMTIFVFNLAEFIFTVYTAIKTRKGIHVKWWFLGDLTNLICKP